MGFYDRDYYREPESFSGGSGFGRGGGSLFGGRMSMLSVTTWLIIINVAVFVVDAILLRVFNLGVSLGEGAGKVGHIWYAGYFSVDTAIYSGQVWRFLTFQFLHADIFHLFFNMLVLYFFGQMIEQYLGSRRYLAFYLLCGIAGTVAYLLLSAVGLLGYHPAIPLVGASAGIFGVLIGAARVAPNTTVMLIFPPIPLRLATLAWILLGIAVFVVLTGGGNAGGQAAHLGGAALGFLLIRRADWLNFADRFSLGRFSPGRIQKRWKQKSYQQRIKREDELEREVDRILDKISDSGLHSLTRKEKRTLHRAREARRSSD